MSCKYCKEPVYLRVTEYLRPVMAPATEAAALEDALIELTGKRYMQSPKRFCHLCGSPLSDPTPLYWISTETGMPNDNVTVMIRMKSGEEFEGVCIHKVWYEHKPEYNLRHDGWATHWAQLPEKPKDREGEG